MKNLENLIALLKAKEDFFESTQYGYIEIVSGQLGENVSFNEEASLDTFANSKPEETEQIVLKAYAGKKTLFIALKEYDVILVYDGNTFSLSQFWKRDTKKIETRPINQEKFKTELLNHFSNVKNQKLSA